MAYITIDKENSTDIELYYEDHGSGKPVVLIHGWPLSGDSWEKQTAALVNAGYRVVTYDRRGFGKSSRPWTGYNYETFSADLNQLLTKLDLREVNLFGFSMGGGEVARYLGTYGSDRISKAGFIAAIPPFLGKTDENPEGVDRNLFKGIEAAIIGDRPAFLRQFVHMFFNYDKLKGKRISDEVVSACWNIAVSASPKGTLDCVEAFMTDFRSDLQKISVPTLVVHGDADAILPIEATGKRTAALVKNSSLVVIPEAPHGLNWTHAEELNKAMLEFLR